MSRVYYESKKQHWQTPQWLFDVLDNEFRFTLDVCASPENTKCNTYIDYKADGLKQSWDGRCFCNPPYQDLAKWLKKGYQEAQNGALSVFLIPARVDTRYWWDFCLKGEIRFIKGRLKFVIDGQMSQSAPFPCAIVIFHPYIPDAKRIDRWIDYRQLKGA